MDWRFWNSVVIFIGICGNAPQLADASTPEYNLQTDLFVNYNPQVRPVNGSNIPVNVTLDLNLINLKSLNEKEQSVTFNGFIIMSWTDVFLQWTPANYSGLEAFYMNPKYVWTPPIGLYNSLAKFYDTDFTDGLYVRVNYNGVLEQSMLGEFTFICDMDPTDFPFDVHTCGLQFATAMTTLELVMAPMRSPLSLELYSENGQWSIVTNSAYKSPMSPSVTPGRWYDRVIFNFKLARMNMFHMLNIVVPLILTILLVPCLFLLPADSGEKLGLGVTVLLALSVFLLTLSDSTPETSSHVPLLTIFVTIQLVVTALSVICSTLILRLHHNNSPKRPPKWAQEFVLGCLARCMCLGDQRKETKEELDEASWATKSPNVRDSLHDLKEKAKKDDEFMKMSPGNRKLLEYLELLAQKIRDDEEASIVSDEWKRIAYVLDWICFWIFSISIVVATITIFVKGSASAALKY